MTPTIREPGGPAAGGAVRRRAGHLSCFGQDAAACPQLVLTGRIDRMANNEIPLGEPLRLNGTFGSTKRSGEWHVPAYVILRRRMGSAKLDFSEAVFDAEHTRLEIDMIGGSPSSAGRSLTISGRAVWGSVEARGPQQPGWARRKR
jgi:hypothetical protein